MRFDVIRIDSPLGPLVLATSGAGLAALEFTASDRPEDWRFARALGRAEFARSERGRPAAARVAAYFDGDVEALDTIRTAADGTPFQRRVWTELRRIPPGATTTYGALAAAIGRPAAARAVGRANALNPIAIVVPCHRVVGADGALTGYAGGVERKRWLLAHESLGRGHLAAASCGAVA